MLEISINSMPPFICQEMLPAMSLLGFVPKSPGNYGKWVGNHHLPNDLLEIEIENHWRKKLLHPVTVTVTRLA
jgi:hypothetical protein